MTIPEVCSTYGVRSDASIHQWLRKFGLSHQEFSSDMSKKVENDPELLKQKIKQLEEQLKLEKIRTEGLNYMIDLAEKDQKVVIRKKGSTKQSKS